MWTAKSEFLFQHFIRFFKHYKTHEDKGKILSLFYLIVSSQKWDLKVKNQNYFSVEQSAWLMMGSNLVSFDQIKLQKVETGIYTNDPLAAVVSRQALSGCPSLAWCCSPLAPKPVCANLCFFSAEYNLHRQASGTAGPGPFYSTVWSITANSAGWHPSSASAPAVHSLSELNLLFEIP